MCSMSFFYGSSRHFSNLISLLKKVLTMIIHNNLLGLLLSTEDSREDHAIANTISL